MFPPPPGESIAEFKIEYRDTRKSYNRCLVLGQRDNDESDTNNLPWLSLGKFPSSRSVLDKLGISLILLVQDTSGYRVVVKTKSEW